MKSKKVIILGTAGNCIDILDTLNTINSVNPQYECVGFLDDNENYWGKEIYDIQVLGPLSMASELPNDYYFVNGIGSSSNFWLKSNIISKTDITLNRFLTIIHPSASVSKMSRLGQGVVVFQNTTITSNVTIGNHVMILPNSIISHDSIIGDYTCIAGGVCLSGNVTVGEACYIGTNSSVKEGISIENYSLIGMGSTVINHIPENSVVVGSPAKFLKNTRHIL